jgi:hypothetical protein
MTDATALAPHGRGIEERPAPPPSAQSRGMAAGSGSDR